MPVFADTAQLYDCLGGILSWLRDDQHARAGLLKSGLVVRFKYTAPDAEITVVGSHEPIEIVCGPCELTPTVEMSMTGDVAHTFWLGKLNLVAALTRGAVRARGPIPALMKLLPLVSPAFKHYPEILREKGYAGLIPA
jgi:hypothetical protein